MRMEHRIEEPYRINNWRIPIFWTDLCSLFLTKLHDKYQFSFFMRVFKGSTTRERIFQLPKMIFLKKGVVGGEDGKAIKTCKAGFKLIRLSN